MNLEAFSVWDWIMYALLIIGLLVVVAVTFVQFFIAVVKWWEGKKK